MSDINMIGGEHPGGDWFTLKRDGDWVYHVVLRLWSLNNVRRF